MILAEPQPKQIKKGQPSRELTVIPGQSPDPAQSSSRMLKKQKVAVPATADLLQGLFSKAKPINKSSSQPGPGPVTLQSTLKDTTATEQASVLQ